MRKKRALAGQGENELINQVPSVTFDFDYEHRFAPYEHECDLALSVALCTTLKTATPAADDSFLSCRFVDGKTDI